MTSNDAVDRSDMVAELRGAFDRYEHALVTNDVEVMNELFWADPRATRYGLSDMQHGHTEIARWRRQATPVPTDRHLERVDVTTFGDDVGVVNCEFRNGDDGRIGRQTQVWCRTDAGWRIASAHVSSTG